MGKCVSSLPTRMNERLKTKLSQAGIPYEDDEGFIRYDWKYWVDVQIIEEGFLYN